MNTKTTQTIVLILIALVACAIITILAYIIVTTLLPGRGGQASPTATPVLVDDSWQRVKSSGRLVVGIAADYPPFEYYNQANQLDGFDIALIRELGTRLGLQVVLIDIAFEGLTNAANLQQIDLAISAISVTPEREREASFSNVYYVSKDGILAKTGSPITSITTLDQMASQRIGVQKSSVYESWLSTNLVITGKMPAANLYAYSRIDQAINDLKAGKLDLAVMDYFPAKDFAAQGGVSLVGEGLNQQRYAIETRKGATTLLEEVNKALTQLQNEGVITHLAEQHLGVKADEIIPMPTAGPPPAPAPTLTPPLCMDGMAFVADLTYPDFNMTAVQLISPGTPFQKGWRLRNVGTCTWNNQYILQYVNGNNPSSSMGGAPTPILGTVPPGGEYDLYVNLVSPLTPGAYQGFWSLFNPTGRAFGQRIWVGIQVPQAQPPTPPSLPIIYRYQVLPGQVVVGQCVGITWQVTGQVNTVQLLRNGNLIWGNAPASGTLSDCPPAIGQYTYEIVADGNGGKASDLRRVDALEVPPGPTPAITPDSKPNIQTFRVTPQTINQGECINISWLVTGNADWVRLYRNDYLIQDNVPTSGSASDCLSSPGSYTYRIQAFGGGTMIHQDQNVTVKPYIPGPVPQPTATAPTTWLAPGTWLSWSLQLIF
jgi:ABC-type amino acid transport substrate-binding protein